MSTGKVKVSEDPGNVPCPKRWCLWERVTIP